MLRKRWGWGFTQGFGVGEKWVTPTDIPALEAAELKNLYDLTAGAGWTDSTNWGTTATADDWFGITVAGGNVTIIDLTNNNLVGSVTVFQPNTFTALTQLLLRTNSNLSGSVVSWILPTPFTHLWINDSSLSGTISGWVVLAALRFLRIYGTSISGTPDMTSMQDIREITYQDCGLSQSNVDGVCQGIYDNWASLTYATPALNVSGTNSVPSGTYQDGDPPTTGLEFVYEIANDPETTGNNTWTVTWNGGSAP